MRVCLVFIFALACTSGDAPIRPAGSIDISEPDTQKARATDAQEGAFADTDQSSDNDWESILKQHCDQLIKCPDSNVTRQDCMSEAYGMYGSMSAGKCQSIFLEFMTECSIKTSCGKPPISTKCKTASSALVSECGKPPSKYKE